jgi:hypothetical protein
VEEARAEEETAVDRVLVPVRVVLTPADEDWVVVDTAEEEGEEEEVAVSVEEVVVPVEAVEVPVEEAVVLVSVAEAEELDSEAPSPLNCWD